MNDSMRFAVIGCGVNARKHAEQLSLIEDARLVAVADVDTAKAQELGGRHGAAAYSNYREMLARSDIDIVNICTPSGMHADMAIAAAAAGKHAIVEKPMDISLDQADAMIAAFRTAGKKLCVISQHRFDAATVRVKQEIEQGRLGHVILAEAAVNWFRSQGYYDSGDWRGTWALDGGGALMNQSIHTIDLFQYLAGDVERVFAYTATLNHRRIEVEDVAIASVRFRSGGLGTIVGTTVAYPGISARLEIFGTRGSALLESSRLTGLYHQPTDQTELRTKDRTAVNLAAHNEEGVAMEAADPAALASDSHRLQFLDMMDAVRSGREPLVNGEEGRKGLEIILAIYASARAQQEVVLSLPC